MSDVATKPRQRTDDEWVFRYGWRAVSRPTPGGTETVHVPLTSDDYLHPQEGDRFMITEAHIEATTYLYQALRRLARGRPDAKVFSDHRVDFQVEGVRPMGPDVIVLSGDAQPWPQRVGTYPVADRGATAELVIEVASPSTRKEDTVQKVVLFHAAGVRTYVIVDEDPDSGDWYLVGYRSTPDGYVRSAPDAGGRLRLEAVGGWLAAEGDRVRVYDDQGVAVPEYQEADEAAAMERARSTHLEGLTEEAILARQQAEREAREADARAAALHEQLRAALAEVERLKEAGK